MAFLLKNPYSETVMQQILILTFKDNMKQILILIFLFMLCTIKAQITVNVVSNNPTHSFSAGVPIQLIATLKNQTLDTFKKVKLNYCVQTYDGQEIKDSIFVLPIVLPNATITHIFTLNALPAGFYVTNTTLDSLPTLPKDVYAFAVDPTALKSIYPQPKDFKQFWVKTLNALEKIPPNYILTKSATLSNDSTDVYSVEMRSLDSVRIQGWYMVPKGRRNLSAIIYFQGYSTNNFPTQGYFALSKNYAQFLLNIRGHGDSQKDVNPGFDAFLTTGLGNKNTYIFRGAYMDGIRAMDFLCSRPEIDNQRIGLWGGSMGSALALVTASLDRRAKLCIIDLPFMSDFRNYFRLTNWPATFFNQFSLQNNIPMTTIHKTLDYFDIKNFAPWVQCPVMMGVGMLDRTCPPPINFAAFNNLKTREKYYFLLPKSGHAITTEHYNRLRTWFNDRL
jgi:cephalosporin-C deacetylase